MTVYDCFLFLNELDLLELRLNELNDVVDYFIIVESIYSFKGDRKKNLFFLQSNKARFEKFWNKIIYLPLVNLPFEIKSLDDVSEHSHWQREMLRIKLLTSFTIKHDDIVIIADLDEIPKKEIIKSYNPNNGPSYLEMIMYRFYINLKCKENPWTRARIVSGKDVIYNTFKTIRWSDIFYQKCKRILNAGWHFTSCGKFDVIKEKLTSFTHYSEPHIPATISGLKDNTWVKNDNSISLCKIDNTYPEDMYKNPSKWASKGFVYSDS